MGDLLLAILVTFLILTALSLIKTLFKYLSEKMGVRINDD